MVKAGALAMVRAAGGKTLTATTAPGWLAAGDGPHTRTVRPWRRGVGKGGRLATIRSFYPVLVWGVRIEAGPPGLVT